MAGGYYSGPPSGREVIWPPPGGLYQSQPPAGSYGSDRQGMAPPVTTGPAYRYLPSYRYRGQYVPPPGPDWPGADYLKPPAKGDKAGPPVLEPGHPVEVVPPPGIPVEEVKQQISRQPHRGWRPVKGGMALPMEPQPSPPPAAPPPEKGKEAAPPPVQPSK